jgi:hypothetical protein
MISFLKKIHWITVTNLFLLGVGLFVFFFFLNSSTPYILLSLLFISNSALVFMRFSLRYVFLWVSFFLNGAFLLPTLYILGEEFLFQLDPPLMETYEDTFMPMMIFLFSLIGLALLINSIAMYIRIKKFRKTQ